MTRLPVREVSVSVHVYLKRSSINSHNLITRIISNKDYYKQYIIFKIIITRGHHILISLHV